MIENNQFGKNDACYWDGSQTKVGVERRSYSVCVVWSILRDDLLDLYIMWHEVVFSDMKNGKKKKYQTRNVSPHIKLRQYGSAAQAVLQHHHGVSQSVLVQLGGILRRLLRDVLEIGLRVRLLLHHVVDGCQKNTHTHSVVYTERGSRRKICGFANGSRLRCSRSWQHFNSQPPASWVPSNGPAFRRNLTQSHISPDVRARGMHKSLYDPV